MANRTGELVQQVLEAHKLDLNSLFDYAAANISGFPSPPSTFKVSQFEHGQSNPTYLIELGTAASGGTAKRYVLRKKRPRKLLQSAHAVEREFQALGDHTEVPVPKAICLCNDSNVIGTPFYIIEYLEGRIFIDPKLPVVAPEEGGQYIKKLLRH